MGRARLLISIVGLRDQSVTGHCNTARGAMLLQLAAAHDRSMVPDPCRNRWSLTSAGRKDQRQSAFISS